MTSNGGPEAPSEPAAPRPGSTPGAALYGIFFLAAFALSLVMLTTDTNLRTDFGVMSSGYYAHWYFVLLTAVADLAGAGLLMALRSRTAVKVGVLGSGLVAVAFVGDILTYSQVGFSSASDFANYLFGITYYPGSDIRYLYDVLLAVYILSFVVGLVLLWTGRPKPKPPMQAWDRTEGKPPDPQR